MTPLPLAPSGLLGRIAMAWPDDTPVGRRTRKTLATAFNCDEDGVQTVPAGSRERPELSALGRYERQELSS